MIAKESVKDQFEGCIVYPYEKGICQCMMVEVPKLQIEEMSYEEAKSSIEAEGFTCE